MDGDNALAIQPQWQSEMRRMKQVDILPRGFPGKSNMLLQRILITSFRNPHKMPVILSLIFRVTVKKKPVCHILFCSMQNHVLDVRTDPIVAQLANIYSDIHLYKDSKSILMPPERKIKLEQ